MPFSAPYNFVARIQKASATGEGKFCLSEEFFGSRVEVCVQSGSLQWAPGSSVLPCAVPVKFPFLLSAHGGALELAPPSKDLSHPVAS